MMAERKSWIEIVPMPLVVALVGIAGTYFITTQQERNAQAMREVQLASTRELADADRQVKILEIFAEKVTSPDENQRILALRLLSALDDELAKKLARAVSRGEPEESRVRMVANQVAEEASVRSRRTVRPTVYIHIRSEEARKSARTVAEQLEARGYVVPGIERLVNVGPNSSQLRFFRESDKQEARQILDALESLGLGVGLEHTRGYETSDAIRPRHYELWFAPGELKFR